MSKEKREVKEKDQEAHKEERKQAVATEPAADPAYTAYLEALSLAEEHFKGASATGDKKLISNAAQKVADIKEQERVRISNLHGYAERLVDTDPQDD